MLLQNKVAVVTGAGVGIGRGIALALAREGARVVVSDIHPETAESVAEEVRALGVEAIAVSGNVAVKSEVANVFAQTKEKFGGVDILVNNAGIYPFVSLEKMEESDWEKVMDVNLKGIYFCSKEALALMSEGGRIISISSIASVIGFEGLAHYCASKGGVNGFTRALALEAAPKGITVNAVAPGAIETPGASGAMSEEATRQMLAGIPMGRKGKPEDIAGAVVYLASDGASYVTGQVIVVDGGWTVR